MLVLQLNIDLAPFQDQLFYGKMCVGTMGFDNPQQWRKGNIS
ncbi:hypothetical protein N752_13445 [Desulforamulus aquiferis]|nr:hypothetical protein N752_13445 [Desulforamulus aquiferis]